MIEGSAKVRVRYSETDKMGYCYYGNYAAYYEVARSEMMREYGFPYSKIEENGYMMPVLAMNIEYKKPAFYDDLLTIKVKISQKPSVKITFEYETYNEKNELLNKGNTTLCFVNMNTKRPCVAPEFLQNVFNKYF